ncbi:O-antigen ligase family protein [Geminicoccus flavidas]|uniref:O-antigen ligase family protein n=1 Tax=Geminicoccus flavidas TaxID=2506407 RepID=UPI00135C8EA2|nr:O-antigen ligase family protein [Geminicoccus flavidas]
MSLRAEAAGTTGWTGSPGLFTRLLLSGVLADLLVLLLVLYCTRVLTPVLSAPDFIDLEVAAHLQATSESNRFNQLFWLGATLLGILAILPSWRRCLALATERHACLLALVGLALVSAAWAVEPGISIRRSLQQAMVVFCVLAASLGIASTARCHRLLHLGLAIALLGNLAALLALPSAFDWRGDFRGIYDDKNGLGAIAIIAVLVGGTIHAELSRVGRFLNLAYLAGWMLALVLAGSKTSIGLLVLVPCVYLVLQRMARSTRLSIGLHLAAWAIVVMALLGFVTHGMGIPPGRLAAMVMPDPTFTDRDVIWQFVLEQLDGHWLLGYGYQSFWNIGPGSPNLAADLPFIHLLNQAHNGYLDVILFIGLPGLALMMGSFLQAFAALPALRHEQPALYRLCCWLIIFALMHNLMESSLLRGYVPVWIFLLFAFVIAGRSAAETRASAD